MMLDSLRHFKANLLSVKHRFCIAVLELVPRTYKPGIRLTIANYLIRSAGIKSGCPVYLAKGFKVLNPRNISIGAYSVFGDDTHIWAYTKVTVGSFTLGAKDLLIIAGSHEINSLRPRPDQEVEIGPGCWIGARVTILGGVKIGKGAVIGACAVVNKDVPDFAVVAGNPARIIRYREAEEVQWNPLRSYKIEEIA